MTTPEMSLIESYQETYGQGGGQKLRDLESMMRSMSLHVCTWFTDVYWLATACYGLLRLATACYGLLRLATACWCLFPRPSKDIVHLSTSLHQGGGAIMP